MSQPPPAEHPCTVPPLNAAHDKYPVSAMPRLLTARSGQLGPGRSLCVSAGGRKSRRAFGFLVDFAISPESYPNEWATDTAPTLVQTTPVGSCELDAHSGEDYA